MKWTVRSVRASTFWISALLTVFGSASPGLKADLLFPAPYLELGQPASSVAVADFNRDGLQDVAVAFTGYFPDGYSDEIGVFFGRGKGEFSVGMHYKVVPVPWAIKVTDFNADASPDLAVLSLGHELSVLLNRGDGTFGSEIRPGDPAERVTSVALADFNGDRRTDIVSVNSIAQDVSVYLSSGNGAFEPARRFTAGEFPGAVAAGDFNRDGKQDLVVVNHRLDFPFDDAFVYRGNGDGTFALVRTHYAPRRTSLVESADLNGDGADDLAMGGDGFFADGMIELSRGDDSFNFEVSDGLRFRPTAIAFGDLNGDSRLDLAYTWWGTNRGATSLRLGNGDGTFELEVEVGPEDAAVSIGDFDPDGTSDLVFADYDLDALVIRPGSGDGTFGVKLFPAGSFPRSLVHGDFNADGRDDTAVVNTSSDDVSVLLGLGDGHFEEERRFGTGDVPYWMVAGEFSADGRQDLAIVNRGSNDVSVLLGLGDGTFATERRVDLGFGASTISFNSISDGDFNRDGHRDLAVIGIGQDSYCQIFSAGWILLGHGDGTFSPRRGLGASIETTRVIAADFNGDGADDLIALGNCTKYPCGAMSGRIQVFLSLGDGTFSDPTFESEAGFHPYSEAASDFDGDGHADLAVASGNLTIFLGHGDGSFARRFEYPLLGEGSVNIADFNADGRQDISVGSSIVILSNGDGTFAAPLRYLGVRGLEAVSGDFNNDGRQDLAGLQEGSVSEPGGPGGLGILLNTGPFPVRPVSVDVKPGVSPNYLNAYARGVLPVAVLGETDFDASTIDPSTVILHGSADAAPAGGDRPLCHLEDVNGDGKLDLLCQFRILDLALQPGENRLILEGKTRGGQRIRGEDMVRVIGRRRAAAALRPLAGSTRAGLR